MRFDSTIRLAVIAEAARHDAIALVVKRLGLSRPDKPLLA
jgi:hypothetical protein